MDVTDDPRKSARNQQERGLSFERAGEFDFESATFILDDRRDYGEERWVAVGNLDGRLHVLCFVNKLGSIRVISCVGPISEKGGSMTSRKPLTNKDGEVRTLTPGDLSQGVPFAALSASLQAKLRKTRGPQVAPKKERITIRLSPDVVASFRATGPGWQARMDEALQEWLGSHSIA